MAQDLETIAFLLVDDDEVPTGDVWLCAREAALQATLHVPPRRRSWRRGRWAAKAALGLWRRDLQPSRIAIVAAEDGAPEAFVGDARLPVTISISHRAGVAGCALGAASCALGFDIERVEARSSRFIRDFFTDKERDLVYAAGSEDRDALACLIWSAKESALKALRTGLRRDTRSVEVSLGLEMIRDALRGEASAVSAEGAAGDVGPSSRAAAARHANTWSPFRVVDRETGARFFGLFTRRGELLLTVATVSPLAAPFELLRE